MASDSSSASTSPMLLTPESTGSPDPGISSAAIKKTRRQTAFYPNMNSSNKPVKPFSRSAAKRESVMALGSIEHLQHYFTKTGIAARQSSLDKPRRGLVPAIGGIENISVELAETPELHLPPPPAVPEITRPAFPPTVKNIETDPDSLLPGVVNDLRAVAGAWGVDESPRSDPRLLGVSSPPTGVLGSTIDVLGILKITTRAVRSIRNYVLSLPDESAGTLRAQFRARMLGPGQIRSPAKPVSSQSDPLTLIRRSALEVLTVLRELEERSRVPLSDEAYDAQSDGGASRGDGGPSRVASPSVTSDDLPPEDDLTSRVHEVDADTSIVFSLVQVQGRYESVPVWEDEEESLLPEEEENKRERWDERLVLGSGWLYRQDVKMEDLQREKRAVASYLDVVDEVLFEGRKEGTERGWERQRRKAMEKEGRGGVRSQRRRVSAGDGEGRGLGLFMSEERGGRRRVSMGMVDAMGGLSLSEEPEGMGNIEENAEGEESVDDEELPDWASRSQFVDDPLGRAHAVLKAFLPPQLLSALAASSSRTDFLTSLSSGQLLCNAYNACVRKSKKPWGYVNKDAIHDILSLERADAEGDQINRGDGAKKGWTFRRTDNLRLWAGALKIRYLLPIHTPSQPLSGAGTPARLNTPLSSPLMSRFPSTEPPVTFDAKVVARREEGWEDMLETVLNRWIAKVVDERRAER